MPDFPNGRVGTAGCRPFSSAASRVVSADANPADRIVPAPVAPVRIRKSRPDMAFFRFSFLPPSRLFGNRLARLYRMDENSLTIRLPLPFRMIFSFSHSPIRILCSPLSITSASRPVNAVVLFSMKVFRSPDRCQMDEWEQTTTRQAPYRGTDARLWSSRLTGEPIRTGIHARSSFYTRCSAGVWSNQTRNECNAWQANPAFFPYSPSKSEIGRCRRKTT